MYVYTIRLELQMEIEQRYVVSCLHPKGMTLPEIVAELASAYREEAFDGNRVKYWLHEIKLRCSDFSDRLSSRRSPLEDTEARILQVLETEPWSSVRTRAEFLKIPESTVYLHLITSLNMKSRYFKWVSHFLSDDLRAKRLKGAQQRLDVLKGQDKCRFRDLMTGDKTGVYFDMRLRTI
jgi:hypothetical protein